MSQPTINLCGIKCLVKIIIVLVIIIAILVAAFFIVGNMTLAKLKIDQVKLGEVTLADLGLSEMTLKSVGTAAWKLCTADEADFVTSPETEDDKTDMDELFDRLPGGLYTSLLLKHAKYKADKLITLTESNLTYIFNCIFSSSGFWPLELRSLGLGVVSTTITEDAQLVITFALNVESITQNLPKVLFLSWPTEAYLQYTASINVTDEGVFDVTNPAFTINGVDADATNAMITALGKTLGYEAEEGKTLDGVILDTIKTTSTTALTNVGQVCRAGQTSSGLVNRSDIVTGNNAGVSEGQITFVAYK